MAAPTVVGASATAQFTNSGTGTAQLPTGLAAGDLILAVIVVRQPNRVINLMSGYTRVSGDNVSASLHTTAEVQAKIAGASESAPTFTSDLTSTHPTGCVLLAVRGWSGSISDIVISSVSGSESGSTITAPDVTAPRNDTLIVRVYFGADDNGINTGPAGHDQRFAETTILGSDALLALYTDEVAAGSAGTAGLAVGGSDPWQTWSVAVPPPPDTDTVTPADATHAHSAEQPTLTQVHVLGSADSLHGHTAEQPTLTQVHALTAADASHGHTADQPALTQLHVLSSSDTSHGHTAEQPTLTQVHNLVVNDATHAHTAGQPGLVQAHELVAADAAHGHTADGPAVTQTHVLVPADATHGHTADGAALAVIHVLVAADALHGHTVDAVPVAQVHELAPNDATHNHVADVAGVRLRAEPGTHTAGSTRPALTGGGNRPVLTPGGLRSG